MNRVHATNKGFESIRDGAALVASIVAPLVLYVLTMPRTVVLEDDGLFLMAGAHLGVAHPPGYPLYTFIVYLFTQLPFGSAAFLGHLSSAVLGAFACGCIYLCGRLIGASPVPALTATWLLSSAAGRLVRLSISGLRPLSGHCHRGLCPQCAVFLRPIRTARVRRPPASPYRYLDSRRCGLRIEPGQSRAADRAINAGVGGTGLYRSADFV